MKTGSVVLLSGGLDSGANLAFYSRLGEFRDEVPKLALSFSYGQKAQAAEMKAAAALARFFNVPHKIVDLGFFSQLPRAGALVDSQEFLPEIGAGCLDDPVVTKKSAQAVWVPNRNSVFISVGASFAESLSCRSVVIGFNKEEAATFPDNSQEYLDSMNRSLMFSTQGRVRLSSATTALSKTEIVHKLRSETPDFPFQDLWSCYRGEPTQCGKCESCLRLMRALG